MDEPALVASAASLTRLDGLLGALLVLVYAWGRFHTPKSNRVSTTALHFHVAAGGYYVCALGLYALLAAILTQSREQLDALAAQGTAWAPSDLEHISGPLLAALLLTVLLPHTPLLRRVDGWLLRFFQEAANIPYEVRALSAQMRQSRFEIPEARRQSLAQQVASGFTGGVVDPDALDFYDTSTPRGTWTKVVALMDEVQRWKADRHYTGYVHAFADSLAPLEDGFQRVNAKAARCLPLLDGAPADGSREAAAARECATMLREQCDELLRELCHFIAQGVLRCELTEAGRQQRLKAVGFLDSGVSSGRLSMHRVVAVMGMVVVAFGLGVGVVGSETAGEVKHYLRVAVMVSAIYGGAVVCAIAPKCRSRLANVLHAGERPFAAYLLSGIMTLLAAAVLSLLFKGAMLGFGTAWDGLPRSAPWFILSFAVAVATAFMADDGLTRWQADPPWLRGVEALVLGGLMAGLFLGVVRPLLTAAVDGRVPDVSWVVVPATIGLMIGATVPHWYRQTVRSETRDPGSEPAEYARAGAA